MEFELGDEVLIPTERDPWQVVAISPGGTWVVVKKIGFDTVRTYRFDSLKKV